MPDGIGLMVQVEELVQPLRCQSLLTRQPGLRHGLGTGGHAAIQLGTIAGRQNQGFFHAGLACQVVQRQSGCTGIEGHLLAQADRRGEVIEPEGDEWHDLGRILRVMNRCV
jgi:hypothetical protein